MAPLGVRSGLLQNPLELDRLSLPAPSSGKFGYGSADEEGLIRTSTAAGTGSAAGEAEGSRSRPRLPAFQDVPPPRLPSPGRADNLGQ